jgi:hypothetical protein
MPDVARFAAIRHRIDKPPARPELALQVPDEQKACFERGAAESELSHGRAQLAAPFHTNCQVV